MVRTLAFALAVTIALAGQALADARVSHIALTDDGVTLCRYAFDWVLGGGGKSIDQPTADCWHIDFASGKLASAPIVAKQAQSLPTDPPPGAVKTAAGVDVCAVAKPS